MVEPSGTVLSTELDGYPALSLAAMGKDSRIVQDKLARMKDREMKDLNQPSRLEEMLIQLILETKSQVDPVELTIETVTQNGIERKIVKFVGGTEISASWPAKNTN